MVASKTITRILPPTEQKKQDFLTFSSPVLQGWRWPYIATTGAQPGPIACIIAGIHGAEYVSMEAALRFAQALEPTDMQGCIVVFPCINLPGFWERSMFVCPLDNKNPNRVFPGRADGTFSEVLAYHFFQEIFSHVDYLIDLHGGDMVEDLIPFTLFQETGQAEVDQRSEALARSFGLPYLLRQQPAKGPISGTTYAAAAERGIPAIIAEAGGMGRRDEESITLLYRGLHNAMRQCGIFSGAVAQVPAPTLIREFIWLYAHQEGLFYPTITVGERVRSGMPIGELRDFFGTVVETFSAPADTRVLFLTTSLAVKADGILMGLGVE